jgi:hypothetical protein
MSIGSRPLSDKRKMKELKVLELHNQGDSYRRIASLVHLSLRDITRFVNLASNKIKSPSVTSIHDEIILEYRVNLLRSEVKELESQRKDLEDDLDNLCAQKNGLLNQLQRDNLSWM